MKEDDPKKISRRAMLAVTAGGIATATAVARAQDTPQPRRPGRGGTHPGPRNPERGLQNPDIILPPPPGPSKPPNPRLSFSDPHAPARTGGMDSPVTQRHARMTTDVHR